MLPGRVMEPSFDRSFGVTSLHPGSACSDAFAEAFEGGAFGATGQIGREETRRRGRAARKRRS